MVKENRIIQVQDRSIGNNLKYLREKSGYKQTTLVRELQLLGYDISIYSYNRIEKGIQNPTVSLLFYLCRIFSCDMNELFGFSCK